MQRWRMARPHIKIHKGEWLVLSERHSDASFMVDIEGEGKTPVEAWRDYTCGLQAVLSGTAREQKALAAQEANFDAILAESERVVLAEALRIGKKVLPVILALVAGILIGRLYG
jgi:hypothetical protein